MKWYSVKKYIAPSNCQLFLMTDYGSIFTGKYTEEHDEKTTAHLFVADMDDLVLSGITHFCVPDPIEIVE